MEEMSNVSYEAYRKLVYETPRFVDYFKLATPVAELGLLNIGSRPQQRNRKDYGIESLR